jgi:FlaA1/EpsC-like NDP-sugar epimerase
MAMIWRPTYHRRVAQLIDASTTSACFVLAYFFWRKFRSVTGISAPIEIAWDSLWKIIGFSIVWVIIFTKQNAYSYQRFTSLKKEIVIVAKTVFFGVFIFFAAHFLFRFGYIPRSYMVIFGGVNFIALSLEKTILFYATKIIRRKRKNKTKILVVGTGTRAKNFIETIEKHLSRGLESI